MCVCVCVFLWEAVISASPSVYLSFSLSISFSLQIQHTAQPCGRKKKKKEKVKATLSSGYAKSAEYSICKPGLAVQTKHDYISRLHVLPCPPFPIFPGEKIMWLGCVISLKLHTSDGLESVCMCAYRWYSTVCLHICLCCARACGHLWVCLHLTGASAVKGWPSVLVDL